MDDADWVIIRFPSSDSCDFDFDIPCKAFSTFKIPAGIGPVLSFRLAGGVPGRVGFCLFPPAPEVEIVNGGVLGCCIWSHIEVIGCCTIGGDRMTPGEGGGIELPEKNSFQYYMNVILHFWPSLLESW